RRADEHHVQLTVELDVVHVATLALEEAWVLAPTDALSDDVGHARQSVRRLRWTASRVALADADPRAPRVGHAPAGVRGDRRDHEHCGPRADQQGEQVRDRESEEAHARE